MAGLGVLITDPRQSYNGREAPDKARSMSKYELEISHGVSCITIVMEPEIMGGSAKLQNADRFENLRRAVAMSVKTASGGHRAPLGDHCSHAMKRQRTSGELQRDHGKSHRAPSCSICCVDGRLRASS